MEGLHAGTTMTVSPPGPTAPGRHWTAALAWALAGLSVLALAAAGRLATLSQPAQLPSAQLAAVAVGAVILATVSAAAVGALLASRRPRHPVGWLLLTPTGRLPSPRWRWWGGSAAPAGSSASSCAGRRCCGCGRRPAGTVR
jgi:hypothetical protein